MNNQKYGNLKFIIPVLMIEDEYKTANLLYSESQNSEFFTQAWEICTISKSLSPEKKWIAEFWSDDFHGATYCSLSRLISIALQTIRNNSDLDPRTLLELLVKSVFVLNDAAVMARGVKYNYLIE
ncbi:MAG: hypothetical protein ABIR66_05420 [Saprospiraceae bacterium]